MKVARKRVVLNVLTKMSTVAMQNRLVRDADGVAILTAPKGANVRRGQPCSQTYAESHAGFSSHIDRIWHVNRNSL
jgi:hypothetical protein